ncbi:T9SS type B sorting domain-containing protein [Olleya sp. YS]|uniref:T9SS type B sorting domain-containing protein n=1 Tax=Olleya sp. YS TaxID=3028318 RepID=UPI0024343A5A|nr:T9SS type B sorting domain-containing protein [Olleya sp. YS]WGD34550.1 T9SS type B sorting domain-containing protein [Olleya sp. YS]
MAYFISPSIGGSTVLALSSALPEKSEIFETISTYNSSETTNYSIENSFKTQTNSLDCTNLISPFNTETNVSIVTDLSWTIVAAASGYLLTVGSTPGGNDVLDNFDVGPIPFYTFTSPLLTNTQYYVTVTPYNTSSSAIGCVEETFVTGSQIPECTALTSPINGAVDVSLSTDISWNAVDLAEGYYLTIGFTSGGAELLNNINVGNVTTYDFPNDLSSLTQVFVTIIPYNNFGTPSGCQEQSFTTKFSLPIEPDCSDLIFPQNSATDVPLSTSLSWQAIVNVEGYLLTIGTFSNGSNITNNLDVGDVTTYDLTGLLEANTDYYVTIIPYNDFGNAAGCLEVFFTTEDVVPECTYLISPYNGELNVLESTSITWHSVGNANGYTLSLGTTSNGTDLVNNLDVFDTSYTPNLEWPEGETIYVSITPYNDIGEALSCQQESFTIIDYPIYAPSFFTANGDTYNDYWEVTDTEHEIKQILIFDRYGKLLKTITNSNEGWDGTFKGRKLPTDDYWYYIELFDGSTQKGHFTLKR